LPPLHLIKAVFHLKTLTLRNNSKQTVSGIPEDYIISDTGGYFK